MTKREFDQMILHLHQRGMKDEDILAMFYRMYAEEHISYDALLVFADRLGYLPSPTFEKMSEEERKVAGFRKKRD